MSDSLAARLAGVIRSPRSTFAAVAAAPRWAGALAAVFLATFLCNAVLLQTEVGQIALVDQWERAAIAFGQPVDDARYASFQAASEHGIAYAALAALGSGPLLTLGVSVLLFVAGNALLKERATFTQVLGVVAHAGVILALRQVVVAPINYVRETLASPTTLGLLAPGLDAASPLARLCGAIDVFVLWWAVVLAVGVAALYRTPVRPLALGFVGVYAALAVVLVVLMAFTGGVA